MIQTSTSSLARRSRTLFAAIITCSVIVGINGAAAQSSVPLYPPLPIPLNPLSQGNPVPVLGSPHTSARVGGPRFLAPAPVPRPRLETRWSPSSLLSPFAPAAPAATIVGAAASSCAAQLASLGVVFERIGSVQGAGRCGIDDAVRVSQIGGARLEPSATINCPTAVAFARFMREQITPAARQHLRAQPQTVHVAASYVCRTRNHQPGARLSEHSFGRAIDVRALTLANGQHWHVAPRNGRGAEGRFQRQIRQAACGPFKTVLGPGSDGFHSDHLHFDLAQRSSTYCR